MKKKPVPSLSPFRSLGRLRHVMLTSRCSASSGVKVVWVTKWSHVATAPSKTNAGVAFECFDKSFGNRRRKTIVRREIRLPTSGSGGGGAGTSAASAAADKVAADLAELYEEFHSTSSETSSRLGSMDRDRRGSAGSFSSRNSLRF